MASNSRWLLLIALSVLSGSSTQDVANNKIDTQEESPLADIAREILKEKNLENIGGVMNSFIESGGAKQLMDGVLRNVASKENSGPLLESLGSLLNGAGTEEGETAKTKGEIDPLAILSGLGALMGSLQNSREGNKKGGDNAAALLQGLGSLLGQPSKEGGPADMLQGLGSILASQAGGNGAGALLQGLGSLLGGDNKKEGGLNPELIGNLVSMIANSASDENQAPTKSKSPKKVASNSERRKASKDDNPFNLDSILSIANTFIGNGKEGASFMDYAPMILNTISSFTGEEAEERAKSHLDHAYLLPPILEKIHVFFDILVNSPIGKQWIAYVKELKVFKIFQNEQGNFDYGKFESLIENHSFRRHWIQQVAAKLIEYLRIVSDERTQNQYVGMGVAVTNSFLSHMGFPKKAVLDMKRPAKSITNFINFAAKKYLDVSIDSKEYVEPPVTYVQGLLKLARQSIARSTQTKGLSDNLTDTINMEVIEPITRVNRGYRFAKSEPKCDLYVFCLINRQEQVSGNLALLRKVLYKGASLISSWFLSSHTGTSYWDFYDVIMDDDKDCQGYYKDSCGGFHHEEIKATTEYVHTEL